MKLISLLLSLAGVGIAVYSFILYGLTKDPFLFVCGFFLAIIGGILLIACIGSFLEDRN